MDLYNRTIHETLNHLNYLDKDTDVSVLNLLLDEYDLTEEQLYSVRDSYITPTSSAIESVEMGLGKTVISLGLLQMIAPLLQNKLVIITAPTNTVNNFYRDVVNNTSFNVTVSTGKQDEINSALYSINSGKTNCLIVTPSAWTSSTAFNLYVYNNLSKIKCFIWDECKGDTDGGFNHFIEAGHHVDFVFPLNATITGEGVETIHKMLYVCTATDLTIRQFKRKYGSYTVTKEGTKMFHMHWDDIKKDFGEYFVNFNREDIGAKTIYKHVNFHHCHTTEYQDRILKGASSRSVLYAPVDISGNIDPYLPPMAIPSIANIIKIIASFNVEENTLVYCRNIEPANILTTLLTNMGYKVFRMDGNTTTTSELKMESERDYNATKGAIMITSLIEGSNLNSTQHVVVYQNPSDVMQYISRAARGFTAKELTLDWIYYPQLEKESFMKNIESAIDVSVGAERKVEILDIMMSEVTQMYPDDERIGIYKDRILKYKL